MLNSPTVFYIPFIKCVSLACYEVIVIYNNYSIMAPCIHLLPMNAIQTLEGYQASHLPVYIFLVVPHVAVLFLTFVDT